MKKIPLEYLAYGKVALRFRPNREGIISDLLKAAFPDDDSSMLGYAPGDLCMDKDSPGEWDHEVNHGLPVLEHWQFEYRYSLSDFKNGEVKIGVNTFDIALYTPLLRALLMFCFPTVKIPGVLRAGYYVTLPEFPGRYKWSRLSDGLVEPMVKVKEFILPIHLRAEFAEVPFFKQIGDTTEYCFNEDGELVPVTYKKPEIDHKILSPQPTPDWKGLENRVPKTGTKIRLGPDETPIGSTSTDDSNIYDPVQKTHYYNVGKIEVIDFIEDKNLNFNKGNAVKYIVRAGIKDQATEIQDLEKAIYYLKREIANLV